MEEKKEMKEKKLSYEELENVAHQLSDQSQTLYRKLQEANLSNMFKRLDYLFAVVENEGAFPDEFVKKCVEEIISTMTIPEVAPEETEEKKEE